MSHVYIAVGMTTIILVLIASISTVCIIRSNRRLAAQYLHLRDETIAAWQTYLENEHKRMLSETAGTVARLNAVSKTMLARHLPPEVVEALSPR